MLARLEMRVFALGNCLILLPGSNLDLECIKINTQMIVDVVNQVGWLVPPVDSVVDVWSLA
jgi:hypothetical protein